MVINMVFNVIFVVWMLEVEFIAPHVGLALATTGSAYFNAWRLARELRRDEILGAPVTFSHPLLKILCGCVVMSSLIYFMLPNSGMWSEWFWYQRLAELIWLILPAILCYLAMLWIMGFRRQHFSA
jgi:putative peptidoglycan lipid II flippase